MQEGQEDDEDVVDCKDELDPELNPPQDESMMMDDDDGDVDDQTRVWQDEDGLQEGVVVVCVVVVYVWCCGVVVCVYVWCCGARDVVV